MGKGKLSQNLTRTKNVGPYGKIFALGLTSNLLTFHIFIKVTCRLEAELSSVKLHYLDIEKKTNKTILLVISSYLSFVDSLIVIRWRKNGLERPAHAANARIHTMNINIKIKNYTFTTHNEDIII